MSEHESEPHAAEEAGHDGHDVHLTAVLGPIDWAAWAMAVLGGALGLLVAASLAVAARS